MGPEVISKLLLASVNLRSVPPVTVVGQECWVGLVLRSRVALSSLDRHRPLGPGVVVGQRKLEWRGRGIRLVAEPVVDLELNAGGCEDVQFRRRNEALARQELAAYEARVWLEEFALGVRKRAIPRDIAPEACA